MRHNSHSYMATPIRSLLVAFIAMSTCAIGTATTAFADESTLNGYNSNVGVSRTRRPAFPKDYEGNWSFSFTNRNLVSQNQNANAWRTEMNLGYSLTSRLDFGISEAYTVPLKFQEDVPSDFDDFEINLTVSVIDPKLKSPAALSLSALLDLPTAHTSQLQTEKFGAGMETLGSYKLSKLTVIGRARVLGYAYQNAYGAPASGPTLPQNNANPDNFSVFNDTDELSNPNVTGSAETGTANVSYYQSDAINFTYAITDTFKVKHQNMIETFSKFDGTQLRILHEQPGLGYKWSKHFSSWYLLDAAKSTEAGGSVYQVLRMTHQLALYFTL